MKSKNEKIILILNIHKLKKLNTDTRSSFSKLFSNLFEKQFFTELETLISEIYDSDKGILIEN